MTQVQIGVDAEDMIVMNRTDTKVDSREPTCREVVIVLGIVILLVSATMFAFSEMSRVMTLRAQQVEQVRRVLVENAVRVCMNRRNTEHINEMDFILCLHEAHMVIVIDNES